MIKALRRIIEGPDYSTDNVEAKTPIVESDKGVKIKALTKMIPASEIKQELKNFVSMFTAIIPPWMLEFDQEEKHYLVSKNHLTVLASDQDVDDWNYLLERFNNLLANLTKLLNNIRKTDYHKIVHDKLLEREIINRKVKITEKLLEKTERKDKEKLNNRNNKSQIENLNMLMLAAMQALMPNNVEPNVNPLDAATLEQLNEDGSALKAAAFLATLEASQPQDVADAFQVMLNRADKNHSNYGGLFQQITAEEQFSPYSAALYGQSADSAAESGYGSLNLTLRELAQMSSAPDAFTQLEDRFGAGSAAIAKQVLDDFEDEGPLSQQSAEFIGGVVSFRGANSDIGNNFKQRHAGGNKFFAGGAIVLPSLLDNMIYYNTGDKTDDLANFIVDKPTIIDVTHVGEPLIVIPTERPIGQEILNIIFKEPFRQIDRIFEKNAAKQIEVKPQTSIDNNTTSINRSPIPKSSVPTSNYLQKDHETSTLESKFQIQNDIINYLKKQLDVESPEVSSSIMNIPIPSTNVSQRTSTNIDTVSEKTQNVFGRKVILMTQDIYTTEE